MYLLVSGRCRVLKRMNLSQALQEKLTAQRSGYGEGLPAFDEPSGDGGSPRGGGGGVSQRGMTPRGSPPRSADGTARSALAEHDACAPMLELGELTQYQYFGERSLLDGKHKGAHSASVVALTPVEVLLLSKYDFYHCIDAKTQSLMLAYADQFYFDDDNIRRSIHKQFRWDAYKQGLLKDLLSPRSGGGIGGGSIRSGMLSPRQTAGHANHKDDASSLSAKTSARASKAFSKE